MIISIIVCTHNRTDRLLDALQSVVSQEYPALNYEIIVVDNCSTDNTKQVVDNFINTKLNYANICYIYEEKLGLSYARNRGIEEARGDIIAFIDDDAIADKDWLLNLAKAFEEEPEAGCVGGRVIPKWTVQQPSWWHPDLDEVFNAVNYSNSRTELHYPQCPYGTNISFRADVLKKAGGFKTSLGRIGTKLLAGEETELCLRIERVGAKIYFEPKAVTYHLVDPAKLNKPFIRKRAFWHGRSHALIEAEHFGKNMVLQKAQWFEHDIKEWLVKDSFPISGQNLIFFKTGYLFQAFMAFATLSIRSVILLRFCRDLLNGLWKIVFNKIK